MTRLSAATLGALPADVARPAYDRAGMRTGIIHLGIGAFHRAHQAVICDDLLAAGDRRWGITGVSLRSAAVRDQLAPQDGLYSLVERDGAEERVRIIGAVQQVLVAPEDPAAVIAALASPHVHLVTLTVTEKGYKLSGGRLDRSDPDVAADLASLAAPRTAPGFIIAGLAARRGAGLPPFTAISCDNLPHNGALLRDAVLELARAHDEGLAGWIAERGAFPQTMVDRIVPATSEADIAALAGRIGVTDAAMVKTEPFLQWVIEDRFASERPDFAGTGVQLAEDVAPWEEAKLRLLNGAHSAIAYLGGLAGIDFVQDFVARAEGRAYIERLWDESATTLSPPAGLDIAAYRAALMARFANPALAHRTRQIAADGSQKLPQRLIAPAAARISAGLPIEALALAIAAWMRWQTGHTDSGETFMVDDPLAATMAARLSGRTSSADQVDALLGIDAIFPAPLAADPRFRDPVIAHYHRLAEQGATAVTADRTAARPSS